MQKLLQIAGHIGRITFLFLFLITFYSCSKDDPAPSNNNPGGCTSPTPPTVASNSPVAIGAAITITASTVSGATGYSWTGPNGFTSTDQNLSIASATANNFGTYTVTVTVNGGCTSSAATSVVADVTAPCNPVNNQYSLSGAATVSFTPQPFNFGVGSSGNYEITCNGSLGDIRLLFTTPSKPTPGIYNVVNSLDPLAPATDVLLSNTTGGSYWTTPSGLLYVTDAGGGKNIYTYCNLSFSESTFGFTTSGSGKITEP